MVVVVVLAKAAVAREDGRRRSARLMLMGKAPAATFRMASTMTQQQQ